MRIYLLFSRTTLTPLYVGSTSHDLRDRLHVHRKRIRIGGNLRLYKELAGTDENDVEIQFICSVAANRRFELEGEWIRFFNLIHPLLNGRHGMKYSKNGPDLTATRQNLALGREVGKFKGAHANNHKMFLSLTCEYCLSDRTEAEIELARWFTAETAWKKTAEYKRRPLHCSYCSRICHGNKGLSCHITNSHKELISCAS